MSSKTTPKLINPNEAKNHLDKMRSESERVELIEDYLDFLYNFSNVGQYADYCMIDYNDAEWIVEEGERLYNEALEKGLFIPRGVQW